MPSDPAACLAACLACAQACDDYAATTLADAQRAALQQCAELCRLLAAFLSRDSDASAGLGRHCAELCEACILVCIQQRECALALGCAEACRHCAAECRRLGIALAPLRFTAPRLRSA